MDASARIFAALVEIWLVCCSARVTNDMHSFAVLRTFQPNGISSSLRATSELGGIAAREAVSMSVSDMVAPISGANKTSATEELTSKTIFNECFLVHGWWLWACATNGLETGGVWAQ